MCGRAGCPGGRVLAGGSISRPQLSATALHVAATAPAVLASLAVIEPEAYSLLKAEDGPAFAAICSLRDQ